MLEDNIQEDNTSSILMDDEKELGVYSNKLTVENGDFADSSQKKEFHKKLVLALTHEGFNLSSTAQKLGIARKSIYNWMEEDLEFERGVRAGSIIDNQIKAMIGVVDNIRKGDLAAQKYYLDKTGYFEKRRDIGDQHNLLEQNEQGVFEIPSDVRRIANSLVDEYDTDLIGIPDVDILKQALSIKDSDTASRLQSVRDRFNEEES
jgi:hypothetical protein